VRIETGSVIQAIIRAAIESVTGSVVAVLADRVVVVERCGKGGERVESRLYVIDAATVVVIDCLTEQPEAFICTEALPACHPEI
jgi:hypothetical protein